MEANLKRSLAIEVTPRPKHPRNLYQHGPRLSDMLEDFLQNHKIDAAFLERQGLIHSDDVDRWTIVKIEIHCAGQDRRTRAHIEHESGCMHFEQSIKGVPYRGRPVLIGVHE